ncbi:MAG: hypothetical protein GY811_12825 [Myxococcales bacterium]|nr:hypothetical protein [Myxococcales bacterium]
MSQTANAGLSDWELSEVHRSSGGDASLRYVELVNEEGGCLFPASTLDLYDSTGQLLDTQSLTVITVCHGAPTYLLLATSQAASYFGVSRDGNLSTAIPDAGQLCFSSSQTNYDCFRWGGVTGPVPDLFGASDTSAIAPSADGQSMVRVTSTHIVAADWVSAGPSPRQPNDGSVWDAPDAGVVFDAGPTLDAGPQPDARGRSDSGPRPDAGAAVRDPEYLDLDTAGGASCGCQNSDGGGPGIALLSLLLLFAMRRRPRDGRTA